MIYNDDIKEEVRARNDIVDVISSRVSLKRAGANYMGLCPFHNEKSPSFSVNRSRQMYHCFGCGASGDVFMFVEEFENFTFPEALKYLADRAGVELPQIELSPEQKHRVSVKQRLLEIYKQAAGYYYYLLGTPIGARGYEYLKKRELSDETIKKFGLGFSDSGGGGLYKYLKSKGYDDSILKQSGLFTYDERKGAYDKFWNRVMFPIMDINSKVIGFGGRVMSDAKPKYLNSPETILFDKSRNLFGVNYARISRKDYFIVCEGYMDVISLHQAGFTNAVAPLGTALTPSQAMLIKRYVNTVYLSFDSDEAGIKAALRAIPIFKDAAVTVKVINLKPYKDPDELIKAKGIDEYQKRIDDAINSFYFETLVEAGKYDLKDPESKTKFFNAIATKLLEFDEEIERNIYADAVAQRYGVDEKEFRRMINHMGAKMVSGDIKVKTVEQDNYKSEKKTIDDAIKLSQSLILTWLGDDVSLFKKLEGIITPDDFKDPVYNKAAHILYDQYNETGSVAPVKIPGYFENPEQQAQVAKIFTTDLEGELLKNYSDETQHDQVDKNFKERAINQLVSRVKNYSIEYDLRNSTDIETIRRCSQDKMKLQKLHISLNVG